MKILNTTLTCLLGLGLAACVGEAKTEKKADAGGTPAAKKDAPAGKAAAAMVTQNLELDKVP